MELTDTEWTALIKRLLEERKAKNPSYSYRALARDLGISQSVLSKILMGQRRMSTECALRIVLALEMEGNEALKMLMTTLSPRKKAKLPAKGIRRFELNAEMPR